jgi:predicted NBD/HSP70 family sugar kinase
LWITARILDPEAVIIGGRLPHHILQEIVARVDDDSFCNEGVLLPRPRVFASSLGPAAGVVGAAAVSLYQRYLAVDD